MPKQPNHEKTAAGLLEEAGRALFDSEDWPSRLAIALNVRRDTIRKWLHDRLQLRTDHFETLLRIIADRQAKLAKVEIELRAWIARQPKDTAPDVGAGKRDCGCARRKLGARTEGH